MPRPLFSRMVSLVSLLALAPAGATPRPPAPIEAHPALWRLHRGTQTIYLFGTVHALPQQIEWYRGPVAEAFSHSDALVTEILDADPEAMKRLVATAALLATGDNLRRHLAPGERTRFERALTEEGLGANALDHCQPWYAAVTLATLRAVRSGFDIGHGVDAQLAARAKAAGDRHEALETAAYQLGLFAALPRATQYRYLHEVVVSLPRLDAELAAMVRAWERGDAARLAQLMNADDAGAPGMREALLVTRNRAWAGWIAARLAAHPARPETVFLAVGAGHLAGADSVIAQLRRRGITPTRLQ